MAKRTRMATEAIVLRSHDVGDADRFCLLLTREHGTLPVRVPGARKLGSKLGSVLLPLHMLHVDLEEHSAGMTVRSASLLREPHKPTAAELATMQEAAELILRCTEDRHGMPEVYALCASFLSAPCTAQTLCAFRIGFLWLQGVLPLSIDDVRFAALSPGERRALRQCIETGVLPDAHRQALQGFSLLVLYDHLNRPLSSAVVGEALALSASGRGVDEEF